MDCFLQLHKLMIPKISLCPTWNQYPELCNDCVMTVVFRILWYIICCNIYIFTKIKHYNKYFMQCSISSVEVEELTNALDSLQQTWNPEVLMVASAEYDNIFCSFANHDSKFCFGAELLN